MNPHFTNALAQVKDEYERLEIIHREDLEIIEKYIQRIAKANRILDTMQPIPENANQKKDLENLVDLLRECLSQEQTSQVQPKGVTLSDCGSDQMEK